MTLPASATSAFEMTSPRILTLPLSLASEVTTVGLSPTARSRYPDLVLRYQSSKNLASRATIKMIIKVYMVAEIRRTRNLTVLLLNMVVVLNMGRFALPAICRFIEYNAVMVMMPESRSRTFSLT